MQILPSDELILGILGSITRVLILKFTALSRLTLINKNFKPVAKESRSIESYDNSEMSDLEVKRKEMFNRIKGNTEEENTFSQSPDSSFGEEKSKRPKSKRRKLTEKLFYFSITTIVTLALVFAFLYYKNNSDVKVFENVAVNKQYVPDSIAFQQLSISEPQQYLSESIQSDPVLDSVSYLSFDPVTGQTFEKSNEKLKRPIASITKLISAYILVTQYDLNSDLTVLSEIGPEIEGMLALQVGDKISANDALNAMLIGSYNDAAYVVAQNYQNGGFEGFVEEMNRISRNLGMVNSSFANPAGLDSPDNYSTASDVRKLVEFILKNELIMEIVLKGADDIVVYRATGEQTTKRAYTTNYLLTTDIRTRGLKTGYTEDAGGCFVGYFVDTDGKELVTIILGVSEEGNRFDETAKLLSDIVNRYY